MFLGPIVLLFEILFNNDTPQYEETSLLSTFTKFSPTGFCKNKWYSNNEVEKWVVKMSEEGTTCNM
jgi:hypothetical protein